MQINDYLTLVQENAFPGLFKNIKPDKQALYPFLSIVRLNPRLMTVTVTYVNSVESRVA